MPCGIDTDGVDAVLLEVGLERGALMLDILAGDMRDLDMVIAAVPDPEGNRHKIVVNEPAEGGEDAHEQGNVSKDQDALHGWGLLSDHVLKEAEAGSDQEEHGAVADISEHDAEEEREGDNREHGWIDFLVVRYAVSVDNLLEHPCDIVVSEKCRRLDAMFMYHLHLRSLDVSVLVLHAFNLPHNSLVIELRNPAEAYVEAALNLELVKS